MNLIQNLIVLNQITYLINILKIIQIKIICLFEPNQSKLKQLKLEQCKSKTANQDIHPRILNIITIMPEIRTINLAKSAAL